MESIEFYVNNGARRRGDMLTGVLPMVHEAEREGGEGLA